MCVCVLISTYEDTSQVGLGPTLMTSFYLGHLFLGSGPGVRTSTYESEGDTFQPMTALHALEDRRNEGLGTWVWWRGGGTRGAG